MVEPRLLFVTDLNPDHNFMMELQGEVVAACEGYPLRFMELYDFLAPGEEQWRAELARGGHEALRRYLENADLVALNERWLRRVLAEPADIVCLYALSNFADFLLPDTLRRLREAGRFVVGFFGDDETMFARNRFWTALFDAVVAFTPDETERYRQVNRYSYLLPMGVAARPPLSAPVEKEVDVVFVGRPYGIRPQLLRAIREAGIGLRIYGSRDWLRYPVLAEAYGGFLPRERFWETLARARIVLNLMEDETGQRTHLNSKVFEAAMAAVQDTAPLAVTTHYTPFESVYGLRDGESIVFYHDVADLIARLRHYLAHDQEREEIARRLQVQLTTHFAARNLWRRWLGELVAQWRAGASESVFAEPAYADDFTIVQLGDKPGEQSKGEQADQHSHHREHRGHREERYRQFSALSASSAVDNPSALREYVLLAPPGVSFDPALMGLVRRYGAAGFFGDGLYVDSLVEGGRLHKSTQLYDLGSSVWRREAFLRHAPTLLRWYRFFGPALPARLARFRLTLLPLVLNAVSGKEAAPFARYRDHAAALRRLRRLFRLHP